MAGKKGKSGGARPGAGRKPKSKSNIGPVTAPIAEPIDTILEVGSRGVRDDQRALVGVELQRLDVIWQMQYLNAQAGDVQAAATCLKIMEQRTRLLNLLSPPRAADADPLDYLLSVMNDPRSDQRVRMRAAITAAQYRHGKIGEGGKKDEKKRAAATVAAGKFAPGAPPRLVVDNQKQ